MFVLEQGSKSIFAGVHFYIKLRKILQNSALEGEGVHDKRKGQEKEYTLCFAGICGFWVC